MENEEKKILNQKLGNIVNKKFINIESNSSRKDSEERLNDRRLSGRMVRNCIFKLDKNTINAIRNIKNADDYYRYLVGSLIRAWLI